MKHHAHRCDIYKIARQCGVKLFDGHLHSPTSRKPFECYCKPTVREIGTVHGEEHLKLVFMLMTVNGGVKTGHGAEQKSATMAAA